MRNFKKLYSKKRISLLITVVSICTISAQKIKGTVSGGGMPLPGASVIVKGTTNGTVTDFDGLYEIEANGNDVIVISYVGFKTMDIAVNNRAVIDVQMIEDTAKLDEVVVIGYGTSKRKDLTGSISSVKAEEIDKIKTVSFEGALAGRVSGVQIVSSEGGPDAAFKIRVRGGTSVNASNDPLYVVDGFPISGWRNYNINRIRKQYNKSINYVGS